MELIESLAVLRKWFLLILFGVALAAGVGFFASLLVPPVYESKTTLMIGHFIRRSDPSTNEINTTDQLARSYAEILRREPILNATVQSLSLDHDWTWLRERVDTNIVSGTSLMEIFVSDTSPTRAQTLADELARQLILQSPTNTNQSQTPYREFVDAQILDLQSKVSATQQQIGELESALTEATTPEEQEQIQEEMDALQNRLDIWRADYIALLNVVEKEGSVNELTVIEPATLPARPVSPNVPLNTLMAAGLGLVVSLAGAFLLEYLDDTIKSGADAQRVLNLPLLGTIAYFRLSSKPTDQVVAAVQPRSPTAEAYRALRTNLQFSSLTHPSSALLVTSANPGEGKSTTAANLAAVMAQAGKRVILADADLRRPAIHTYFGVGNEVGLTNLLLDESLALEEALADSGLAGLSILPSGPLPPNPAELLSSLQMEQLLGRLKEKADLVIFDTPPLLAVTDASALASQVGAVLFVVDSGSTRSEVCRQGQEVLDRVGVKPLGVLLNKMSHKRSSNYAYQYYYSANGHGPSANGRDDKPKGSK